MKVDFDEVSTDRGFMGIGAYYKDDTENGIQLFADKISNPPMYNLLSTCTDTVWADVNASITSGKLTRQHCIDQSFELLDDLIPVYNMNMYGSYKRKMNTPITKAIDKDFAKIIVTIASSIKVLTELNAIPNDEYNGMLYFEAM